MSDIITAASAEEGKVYKTCESELSYFAKFIAKSVTNDNIKLAVYMPKTKKWKETDFPGSYKLRDLTEEEKGELATMDTPKVKRERKPRDPNLPKSPGIKKEVGVVSGLGMIAAWAKYIGANVDKVGGRSLTVAAMLADFPAKAESINRWVDAYLTYYNTGRFSNQGVPRQQVTKVWNLTPDEIAAGNKVKKPKALGPAKPPKPRKQKEVPAEPAAV